MQIKFPQLFEPGKAVSRYENNTAAKPSDTCPDEGLVRVVYYAGDAAQPIKDRTTCQCWRDGIPEPMSLKPADHLKYRIDSSSRIQFFTRSEDHPTLSGQTLHDLQWAPSSSKQVIGPVIHVTVRVAWQYKDKDPRPGAASRPPPLCETGAYRQNMAHALKEVKKYAEEEWIANTEPPPEVLAMLPGGVYLPEARPRAGVRSR